MSNAVSTEHSEASFKRQPNSRFCFVCGLESPVGLKLRFSDNGADEVRACCTIDARYQGYPGVVHGGVVAAMLDETAGRVTMISNPDRFMMTGRMTIRYRKPVPTETELTLIGHLIRDRGRTAQAHSEIRLPDGTLAAEAELTLIEIPRELIPDEDLETLGWRVYPDDPIE
ncbi:MAG TPA: PaaI family thioesterase [Chloroflexi bacterium]|nr:PaaI family thioesterase [Chloroflexota bacterium]